MNRIQQALERHGMTQKELADYLGVDRSSVTRMAKRDVLRAPILKLLDRLDHDRSSCPPAPPCSASGGSLAGADGAPSAPASFPEGAA